MSALIASSLGHIFLGFAMLAFRLCAQSPKEMIAITDRQSHTFGPGLLILRTLAITWPQRVCRKAPLRAKGTYGGGAGEWPCSTEYGACLNSLQRDGISSSIVTRSLEIRPLNKLINKPVEFQQKAIEAIGAISPRTCICQFIHKSFD